MTYSLDSLVNGQAVNTRDEQFLAADLKLSPNPASGPVQLQWQGLENQPTQMRVLTLDGQEIWRTQFTPQGDQGQVQIDLQRELPSGVYLVQLQQGGRSQSLRLSLAP